MSGKLIYKNENSSITIKKFELLFKNELISFLVNSEISELNSLEIFGNNLANDNIKEKINLLIDDENIQKYILENNKELIGLYLLKKGSFISFIIKKEQRNKGYGKLGLFLLIKELSNIYQNTSEYFFTIKKGNIWAHLIVLGNNAEKYDEKGEEMFYKIKKGNQIWLHRIGIDDMPKIMKITTDAKNLLKQNGSLQWQQGYPDENTFINDINNNSLYGLYQNDELMAYGAFVYGKDINYVDIDGKWDIPANDKDMAIHRVAVEQNQHGKKYGIKILKYGIKKKKKLGCVTVKVDTHKNNIPMQKSIIKSGFIYKGVVKILRDKLDNLRFAYEIVL